MKNLKLLLSGFVVLAIVFSSLAFKGRLLMPGTVYCLTDQLPHTCNTFLTDYIEGGTVTTPCPAGRAPYIIDPINGCIRSQAAGFTLTDSGQ
jgi:hypothetical protein